MKIALSLAFITGAAAFSQDSRREALAGIAAAGAALVPAAANAAAGESPRFSIFGLIGDGTSYSEGAAYGSDQSTKVYSPYSVYGDGENALYKEGSSEYAARKKAVVEETKVRLNKIPAYLEKSKWYEVTNELDRYMYETRAAINYLAKSPEQKKAAKDFYVAVENISNNARLKRKDATAAATSEAIAKLGALSF
eukprot:scaffold674_cov126-Cylindrotheca_fusiformis.AAC.10